MLKSTLDKKYLQKVVNTTQKIEGYSEASKKSKMKLKL